MSKKSASANKAKKAAKRATRQGSPRPGFFFCLLAVLLVAANAYLAHSLLVGEGGLPAFLHLQTEQARLQQNIDSLVDERARLSRKIQLLESDDAFAERIVREQTRFVREDEIVYFVDQASPSVPQKAQAAKEALLADPEKTP